MESEIVTMKMILILNLISLHHAETILIVAYTYQSYSFRNRFEFQLGKLHKFQLNQFETSEIWNFGSYQWHHILAPCMTIVCNFSVLRIEWEVSHDQHPPTRFFLGLSGFVGFLVALTPQSSDTAVDRAAVRSPIALVVPVLHVLALFVDLRVPPLRNLSSPTMPPREARMPRTAMLITQHETLLCTNFNQNSDWSAI
jgi:hypothetical protein